MKKKVFVIISNSYMGDILLVNSLVQNIKTIYKNSVVVILTEKCYFDAAKYQSGVDDVIIWDRGHSHKSILGTLKFVLKFPYKNIYAAFPLYSSDRMIILAFLLGAKYILFYKKKNIFDLLMHSKYKINAIGCSVQESDTALLSGISKAELLNYPIKFYPPMSAHYIIKSISKKPDNYIALCAFSSKEEKDLPLDTVLEIIEKMDKKNKKNIIFLGCGKKAKKIGDEIEKKNYANFINLVNKTSIIDLANILQKVSGLISVDTGTMHLACAVNCPVAAVFYQTETRGYMPDTTLYKAVVINNNQTAQNIISNFESLVLTLL